MFNIGAGEMVLILVVALLVLGPQRLPELARGIGKFMREFRRQTDEVRNVVEREFYSMDQEISREPTPPVRPGSSFAYNPPTTPVSYTP
ncbi:Sec-independent protein translocase protein TatB, partial [Pyxidicoccus fallax]